MRRINTLQADISTHKDAIKKDEEEVEALSVRIAELMECHEHGILETTTDNLLVDFVTRTTRRPNSAALKKNYPDVYKDVLTASESRKIKVSLKPKSS